MGAKSKAKRSARRDAGARSAPAGDAAASRKYWIDAAIAIALLVATFLLYIPILSNGFVNYDDDQYITANKIVQRGLTGDGFVWAFTTDRFGNWLPVTWLSHMLDVSLFGLKPGLHHATSAVLHALNVALLFVLLRRLLGNRWCSLAAAVLFGVHPLRVESVAWVAERKDVLAATFFLLTLLAYVTYCRRKSRIAYAEMLFFFALGLMSKTMLVTVPCLLLVLDWWPLRRIRIGRAPAGPEVSASETVTIRKAVLEKLPLAAMAIIASAWTVYLQKTGGMMATTEALPPPLRLGNAVVSVPRYLLKMLWPRDLSILYPYPMSGWETWKIAGAIGLIVAITLVVFLYRRRLPFLLVGWLWFIGMLVPVVGIVQVGIQSMADRYTYLPGIGVTVAAVWGVAALLAKTRSKAAIGAVAVVAISIPLAILTVAQQRTWADTYSLFSQALASDEANAIAHSHVGTEMSVRGDRQAARAHFRRAIELDPLLADPHYNLGNSLSREAIERRGAGDRPGCAAAADAAIAEFVQAIRIMPTHAQAYFNLGIFATMRPDLPEAQRLFAEAVRMDPEMTEARLRLVEVLIAQKKFEEAAAQAREALAHDPDNRRVRAVAAQFGITNE